MQLTARFHPHFLRIEWCTKYLKIHRDQTWTHLMAIGIFRVKLRSIYKYKSNNTIELLLQIHRKSVHMFPKPIHLSTLWKTDFISIRTYKRDCKISIGFVEVQLVLASLSVQPFWEMVRAELHRVMCLRIHIEVWMPMMVHINVVFPLDLAWIRSSYLIPCSNSSLLQLKNETKQINMFRP